MKPRTHHSITHDATQLLYYSKQDSSTAAPYFLCAASKVGYVCISTANHFLGKGT